MVTSTKANAAKFIFRVPEELWADVKGRGLGRRWRLRDSLGPPRRCLWRLPRWQNSEPGEYKFEGDLNSIPVAPDWLLAEMKQPPKTINKKDLDFSDRTHDEIFSRSSLNVCRNPQ